jgi:hypothetical protein
MQALFWPILRNSVQQLNGTDKRSNKRSEAHQYPLRIIEMWPLFILDRFDQDDFYLKLQSVPGDT